MSWSTIGCCHRKYEYLLQKFYKITYFEMKFLDRKKFYIYENPQQ